MELALNSKINTMTKRMEKCGFSEMDEQSSHEDCDDGPHVGE